MCTRSFQSTYSKIMEYIITHLQQAEAFLKDMLAAGPPLIPPAAIIPSTSAIHAYIRHSLKGLSVQQATVSLYYITIKCSPSSIACTIRLCRPYTTNCLKNGRKQTVTLLSNADSMYYCIRCLWDRACGKNYNYCYIERCKFFSSCLSHNSLWESLKIKLMQLMYSSERTKVL